MLPDISAASASALEQTTIENRQYALDKRIYPSLGNYTLRELSKRTIKELVEDMAESLAPSTIRDYVNVVKVIVASAIDENGEQLFPRKWNDEYIDAPLVGDQNQPSTTSGRMTKILEKATRAISNALRTSRRLRTTTRRRKKCVESFPKIFGPTDGTRGMLDSGGWELNFGAQLVHNSLQLG